MKKMICEIIIFSLFLSFGVYAMPNLGRLNYVLPIWRNAPMEMGREYIDLEFNIDERIEYGYLIGHSTLTSRCDEDNGIGFTIVESEYGNIMEWKLIGSAWTVHTDNNGRKWVNSTTGNEGQEINIWYPGGTVDCEILWSNNKSVSVMCDTHCPHDDLSGLPVHIAGHYTDEFFNSICVHEIFGPNKVLIDGEQSCDNIGDQRLCEEAVYVAPFHGQACCLNFDLENPGRIERYNILQCNNGELETIEENIGYCYDSEQPATYSELPGFCVNNDTYFYNLGEYTPNDCVDNTLFIPEDVAPPGYWPIKYDHCVEENKWCWCVH